MIDFFFDVSSPWTYLAFRNIQPMALELNVAIHWRPVLVGGIFNTVNQRMYTSREDATSPRNRYVLKDLQVLQNLVGKVTALGVGLQGCKHQVAQGLIKRHIKAATWHVQHTARQADLHLDDAFVAISNRAAHVLPFASGARGFAVTVTQQRAGFYNALYLHAMQSQPFNRYARCR